MVSFSVALDTKAKQTNKSVFSKAFEANASSSGGIQTDYDLNKGKDGVNVGRGPRGSRGSPGGFARRINWVSRIYQTKKLIIK